MLFCVVTTEMTIMTGERGQTRNGRGVRTSEVEDESKRKEREEGERDSAEKEKKTEGRKKSTIIH